MFKLGSLFDGAGTFPLAGKLCGVKPVWASEIEPFPVSVTEKRLPNMKHLGDITKVNGADIEPVDIITFGSPCQDLSVAGKRAGLDGERSGLFMEAVRIIKEMRGATNERYPQIAMWENVPGAFSSNKGEDFRVVLEELCKICDSTISIPRPTNKRGKPVKWEHEGCIVADGFSIAWRLLDAQFWGVPQRRKRIFLVADFGGQCAGEILFECGGLSRNFTQSREKEQGLRPVAENGFGKANRERERERVVSLENHPADSRVEVIEDGKAQTLTSRMGTGGGNVPLVLTYRKTGHAHSADEGQGWEKTDIADTLNVSDNTEARTPVLIVEQKQRERERVEPGAYGVPLGFRPENTRLYREVATTICNGTNPGHHQGVLIIERRKR